MLHRTSSQVPSCLTCRPLQCPALLHSASPYDLNYCFETCVLWGRCQLLLSSYVSWLAANVLLTKEGRAKLGDAGAAALLGDSHRTLSLRGTMAW